MNPATVIVPGYILTASTTMGLSGKITPNCANQFFKPQSPFEVHEILEHSLLHAAGSDKLTLQAMIRAAGMYVQLDRDNIKGAASMAAKSVEALERYRSEVPNIFDLDLLLSKLKDVDPVPSKFMRSKS